MGKKNRIDRRRLSDMLEMLGKRLPAELFQPEYADLSQHELGRLFRYLAEHVRTCSYWPEAGGVEETKETETRASLYADGASRGNPGPAGAGIVIVDQQGRQLFELNQFLGNATNNEAEYQALIAGLRAAEHLGITRLQIFLDSELIVKQVRGDYRVRNVRLQALFGEVMSRLRRFSEYDIIHVPREHNRQADRLANEAVERGLRGGSREELSLGAERIE